MLHSRKPQPLHIQIWDLFLIELTSWRWSWRSTIILGAVSPLLTMFGLSIFARDSGTQALHYIFTGNIILSLMFGLQNSVGSHFAFMKVNGTLAYFASLPIKKPALILAVTGAFFILNLPAILLTMFIGAWFLGLPVAPHPLLLLVIPAAALPMAGIGALIGVGTRNPQQSNMLTMLVSLIMPGMGSVIFPPDHLPQIFQTIGRFNPATYAASALRQTLLGPVTPQIWVDCLILILMTLAIFALVSRLIDWREK